MLKKRKRGKEKERHDEGLMLKRLVAAVWLSGDLFFLIISLPAEVDSRRNEVITAATITTAGLSSAAGRQTPTACGQ